MPESLITAEFLNAPGIILDVRSPQEYAQGHIPGAISFPLFSDEERAEIGICYKHQGSELAIELGLKIVGPKLFTLVTQAKTLAPDRQVRVHCWRGGMRSGSIGWLLETAGFKVILLEKGYKSFRHWVRSTLAVPHPILILGGMTGTGKTDSLMALAEFGEQILDLEALASNRGSSYGGLGLPPQPKSEQFENSIAMHWHSYDLSRPVWIEAESRRIGRCQIPVELFQQMEKAPVIQISRPKIERVAILIEVYGSQPLSQLIVATQRLHKRLGGLRTQQAIDHICNGNLAAAIALVLEYYDKTYTYDLQRRTVPIHTIDVSACSAAESAVRLRSIVPVIWSQLSTVTSILLQEKGIVRCCDV
jgi:tRNA 2-selenouridine synthase